MKHLYWSYGSNCNVLGCCHAPGAKVLKVGVLRHYRLVERLYADIEPSRRTVHGVLWRVSEADWERLIITKRWPKEFIKRWPAASIAAGSGIGLSPTR